VILVLERSAELADQVRDIAEELPGDPEVVVCTRVGSATHVQEHDGPFAVVLAGPSLATRAGLKRLAGLHAEMPGTSFVIAIEHRPDASLREIVQVGAVDLLELPADDAYVRSILKRALEHAAPSLAPAAAASTSATRAAKVITVCSATGGCGKTFYATNLATFLATHSGARVALVDLDLQFGEISTALRLQPAYTIVDAVQGDPETERDTDLTEHIEDYLVRFQDSFWTLAAPREPSQADDITAIDTTRVLEALRKRFDYVIVDTPTALAETVLAALDISDHLFVLATLDLPAVRNLGVFLQTLHQLRIPEEHISLVLNKVEHDVGIDVSQLKRLFPQGFRSTLPYAREVSRSINNGVPVLLASPDAQISRRLSDGLVDLLPEELRGTVRDALAQPAASHGVLSRFLRRRAPVTTSGTK
jgi:pilus assembly protein CpaE